MEKIKLLFLINEMYINNFECIYNITKESREFELVFVACDSREANYKDKTTSKEVYKYLLSRHIECIDGYDYEKKEWIDLSIFNPDYIFVSTPYDIYRPEEYNSSYLSSIAKLCNIEYGGILNNDFESLVLDNPFWINCSYCFISDIREMNSSKKFNESQLKDRFIPVGCVKVDKYLFFSKEEGISWKKEGFFGKTSPNSLRIVWKPRWTLEHIDSFFLMLLKMIEYVKKKGNEIDLLLIEHPLLRSTMEEKGVLDKYSEIVDTCPENFICYSGDDFLDYVLQADVLIGEITSLMLEFSITNRPIILLDDYRRLNNLGKVLIDVDKVAKSFEDVEKILISLKHSANIRLVNQRVFSPGEGISSSEYILNFIKHDFLNMKEYYKKEYSALRRELIKIEKILTRGYYQDILNNECYNVGSISKGLKMWNNELVRLKRQ